MSKHIFVSYSKKDSDFAIKFSEDLEAAGFKIWIDRSIGGGDAWRESIEENLQSAGEVIVVLSPNAIASRWVQHEGSMAYSWGKPIFPLVIEDLSDADLPIWMDAIQYIDFVEMPYEDAFAKLIKDLTPPNPIQDLLDQQVIAYTQTGDLMSAAILQVIEEARDTLEIDEEAKELMQKSRESSSAPGECGKGG